jgi:hypothetical protein
MEHTLSDAHAKTLSADSSITTAILEQRGYCTIQEPQHLLDAGYSHTQSFMVPCLGIPLWNVYGEQRGWQIRPDHPRTASNGRLQKYETPYRARLTLDVHPAGQPLLGDPAVPLWITEGVKKGDALTSRGVCAIALMGGVWGWRGKNAMGGKVVLPDWDAVALNDRDVYIVYDNDVMRNPAVRSALEALCGFLRSKQAKAHLVLLPEGSDKLGVDDYLAQGHTLEETLTYVAEKMPPPAHAATLREGLPLLTQNPHELPALIEQSLDALMHMPGAPRVFQRARFLVTVEPATPQPDGIKRTGSSSVIHVLFPARLRVLLAEAANWQTPNTALTKAYPAKPEMWLTESLLALGTWPVPPLMGLVACPTMRLDGTILTAPGYDILTGLWLANNGFECPAIPEEPSMEDVALALAHLREPLRDFPFAEPWHESAALAAILSMLCRYAVDSIPLFAIRATTRGSGKTLLADVISLITLGRLAPKIPQVRDEEEERKRLLGLGLDGQPLVCIDNVAGEIGSPSLEMAITTRTFQDRLLGQNKNVEVPLYTIFLATGNNMQFRGDMARRSIPIDLVPAEEKPEQRTGFVHPDLLTWVLDHRATLVAAGLTLLRAYTAHGAPRQPIPNYGGFDAWSHLVRGCLVWAGMDDPYKGHEGLEEVSDPMFDMHAELLEAWHECYEHTPVLLQRIMQDIAMYGHRPQEHASNGTGPPPSTVPWDRLKEALGAFDNKFDRGILHVGPIGNQLKKKLGRNINGKRLMQRLPKTKYGILWMIETVSKTHKLSGDAVDAVDATPNPLPKTKSLTCHQHVSEKSFGEGVSEASTASTASPAFAESDVPF